MTVGRRRIGPCHQPGLGIRFPMIRVALHCCSFTLKIIVRLSRIFWFIQRTLSYNFGTHLVAADIIKNTMCIANVCFRKQSIGCYSPKMLGQDIFSSFLYTILSRRKISIESAGVQKMLAKNNYRNFAEKCGTIHSLHILIVLLRRKTPISE